MFIQIQLQAALWSGSLNAATRRVLARACEALDVSAYELVQMEALLRMQQLVAAVTAQSHSRQ